jgi:hypothetical protein
VTYLEESIAEKPELTESLASIQKYRESYGI